MPAPRRARSDAAKQARRQRICQAAAARLGAEPYADISMAEVARDAGVAKGTLYLYFSSKEALFLGVLQGELSAWGAALSDALGQLQPSEDPRPVAAAIAASFLERPLLLELVGLKHAVLEKNVDAESAKAFKLDMLGLTRSAAEDLRRCLPGLGAEFAPRSWLHILALTLGLRQAASPPEGLAEVMDDPDLAELNVDLHAELERGIAALLRGFLSADDLQGDSPAQLG